MANVYAMSDVWDDADVEWTAIKMDVVDTASHANSKLLDLRIGGVSKATISKAGAMALSGGLALSGGFDVNIGGTSYLSASASGAFATTPPVNDNSLRIATTAFVLAQMAAGRNRVQVEAYGAVADSIIVDNTAAINAAEAAAKLLDATVEFRDGLPYYYQGTLVAARDRLSWSGRNTQLIYNGANTTRNHFVLGDGVTSYRDCLITGIEFGSVTVMTAGTCVWARRLCRSILDIETQAQELNETLGNNLWNAVWIDGFDNVTLSGEAYTAQNDVIRVNGAAGAGPKAELFLEVRKAFDGLCGVRIGGGAGGVYFGWSTIELNLNNVIIDQTLLAEANREVMIQNATLDYPLAGGNNLIIDDAGFVQIQVASAWIGSAPNHNVWIKNCGGNVSMGGGYRIYGALGDGIRVDDADAVVLLGSGQIHGNGGYGVNPTVTGHRVVIDGALPFSNTIGNVNLTYAPTARSFSNYAEFTDILAGRVQAPQMFVDSLFGSYLSGGNPYTAYDTNDYSNYDRTANRYGWFIAGGQVAAFSTAGISVGPGNDTILTREASDTLGLRRGTNAQNFFVSGTWTDASNFERGVVGWNTNNFDINTAQAGTGTSRNLRLYTTGAGEVQLGVNSAISWKIGSGGHWLANADATYNIGASGANRPNHIWAAGNGVFGGALTVTGAISSSAGISGTTGTFSGAVGTGALTVTGAATASTSFAAPTLRSNTDAGTITLGASNDVVLQRDSADILALRRGTNAQGWRVYNTYTDASNNELNVNGWFGNVFYFGTQKLGTGQNRAVQFIMGGTNIFQLATSGHLTWNSDNTYDIGASGARVRIGYFGTSLNVSGATVTASTPVLNVAQTWNNAAIAFDGILANFTNTASGAAMVMRLQVNAADVFSVSKNGQATFASNIITGSANGLIFSGRSIISSPANGNVLLQNQAQNDFGMLIFGLATSSFPALKRSGSNIQFRKGDDSAFSDVIANGLYLQSDTALIGMGATTDTVLWREAAGIFAQRNGTNAQAFRLYKTYTDSSNYERLEFGSGSTYFSIGVSVAGTGTAKDLRVGVWSFLSTGHFVAQTDNTYDLGTSGVRVRTGYFGTSLVVAGVTVIPATSATANTTAVRDANGFITASGYILSSASPGFHHLETDAAVSGKVWSQRVNVGVLTWAVEDDSYSTPTTFMSVTRSGLTVSSVAFAATAINLTGAVGVTGALTATSFSVSTTSAMGGASLVQMGALSFGASSDVTLQRDGAADILALRRSTNAQAFNIYNTWTDASNYERAALLWTSNKFSIRTQALGTGTARNLELLSAGTLLLGANGTNQWTLNTSGTITPDADNAYSLGSPTQRISQAFFVNPFIYANTPAFTIVEKDEAASGKVWNLRVNGGVMSWNVEDDAYTTPTAWMTVTRSGLTVSSIAFAATAINFTPGVAIAASTTAKPHINLAAGAAPTAPANGDIWFDGADLKMRVGGVTKTFTLV